jgi:hypothetical protein
VILCKSENTKTLGIRFSALLTKDGTERLELAKTWREEAQRGPLGQSSEPAPQYYGKFSRASLLCYGQSMHARALPRR